MGQGHGAGRGEGGPRGAEQVRFRFDATKLRGLDETVEERGHLGPPLGAGAVVVLAAHDRASVIPPMSRFARGSTTGGIRRGALTLTFNTGR
jgi:hypothetical protein